MRRKLLYVLLALSVVAGLLPGPTALANVISDGLVLNFPAANITNMAVYEGYRDSTGEVVVPYSPVGAWHYPGTAWPGQGSNSLLFGHDQPGYFGGMDGWYFSPSSHIGQKFTLTRTNGLVMNYTVTYVGLVSPYDNSILTSTSFDQVTLLTCTSFTSTDPKQIVRATLDFVAPGPPTNVSAVAGQNSAVIRWGPPDFFGYNAPTSYTVTAYPSGGSVSVPGSDSSAGINNLTPGQGYSFTVTATNSAGSGPPTGSNQVIPYPLLTASMVSSVVAGSSSTLTIRAIDGAGNLATGYNSTLQFSSSDARATLPPNGSTISGGTASYPVTMITAGLQSISDRDSGNANVSASAQTTVLPGPVQKLAMAIAPLIAEQAPAIVTVSAEDAYGNVQPAYAGTVHLAATPAASLTAPPPDHAFWSGDGGVFRFTIQPAASATGTALALTAADTVNTGLTASATATVGYAFYFTWFDRISSPGFLADNIHVLNPNSAAIDLLVTIPAGFTGPCPAQPAHLLPNEERVFTCANGFGGPVQVVASLPVQASQRVQYYGSFNEVAAQPFSAAQAHLVLTWFDRISSPGFLNDNIHVLNPGAQSAHVTVTIPTPAWLSPADPNCIRAVDINPGTEAVFTCATGFGGPVTVDSTGGPVLASQRVQYYQSFNEVSAAGTAAASTSLVLTWFDRISDVGFQGDNIHVVNPDPVNTAHVTITIPTPSWLTPADPSCIRTVDIPPLTSTNLPLGTATQIFTCRTGFGGPVTINSNFPVLATQRVQYYQSFNEVPAEPTGSGMTSIEFLLFDRISSPGFKSDNIHVVNPDPIETAHVTVSIPTPVWLTPADPGCIRTIDIPPLTSTNLPIGSGTQIFTCLTGYGGPVTVTSTANANNKTIPVLASQRVQYYQSFNEVPATGIGT